MTQQCMGGWCAKRAKCPHYVAPKTSTAQAERLCIKGRDGVRVLAAAAFRVSTINVFDGHVQTAHELEAA